MTVVFVPRERRADEQRVAATPDTVAKLIQKGADVRVESGAGAGAWISDAEFSAAGAGIVADAGEGLAAADVVIQVGVLTPEEVDGLPRNALVVGLLDPFGQQSVVERAAAAGLGTLAMEMIPRITRAQSMDALSSQASIGGYKAVLLAAARLGRYFPLLMTAAGTVRPSRVVILGGGVAGLQALATAKRLGAVVEVSDIRPAVKEQVESLGGRFIEPPDAETGGEGSGGYAREMGQDYLDRQREELKKHIAAADVVICTAQVPGKRAPRLVDEEMVHSMSPGSVIVDLAAEQGGNCALTRAGEETIEDGVIILGPVNTPATVSRDASTLYARNLLALLELLIGEDGVTLDREDEIIAGALITHGGEVVHPALREAYGKAS